MDIDSYNEKTEDMFVKALHVNSDACFKIF